jgi:hypothetical protein
MMKPCLAFLAAAALTLAGCAGSVTSSPSSHPIASPPSASPALAASQDPSPLPTPRTSPPPGTVVRFDSQELTDGNRLLTLHFVGGRAYSASDPCSHEYAGWAEQVGHVLEAAVIDVTPVRPAGSEDTPFACDAIGYGRSVSVRLPSPFLGSRLHDKAGYMHFLRRPEGLVELHGLPSTWLLRSERDVEDSPTGRWQRTYSPLDRPEAGTSRNKIDFYQAFAGPVNVTGGEQRGTITVNGKDATLYRSATDGELVLVWDLGPDGLALVVNESDFPVEKLIMLAESAAR